jgi:hypothetical protein
VIYIIIFPAYAREPETKILFIGNSFTSVNDLPDVFKKLAASGGHNVLVDQVSQGGYTLEQYADPNDQYGKIAQQKIKSNNWDYVVLQEQSEIPAYDNSREGMYEGARALDKLIKSNHSKTMFFLTWGYKNGDTLNVPVQATQTFEGMQQQLDIGYTNIANELNAQIAPVGIAWLNAKSRNNTIDLWQDDHKHPNINGTYLSACVFYATIFNGSPAGLKYTAGIDHTLAKYLQDTAYLTCLDYKNLN